MPSRPASPNTSRHPAATDDDTTVHHTSVRAKRRKAPGQEKMELQLTSMIDVIFLLLIYFVITATFMIDEGFLDASLPSGPASAPEDELPKEPVVIELAPAGNNDTLFTITVDNQPVDSFTDLYTVMNNQSELQGGFYAVDTPLIIKPRARVRWQHVVNAFNALVRAKYEAISFAPPS
ncbi:MAG: biopolymer transporter ExbD [Planctomycetota bacterium]